VQCREIKTIEKYINLLRSKGHKDIWVMQKSKGLFNSRSCSKRLLSLFMCFRETQAAYISQYTHDNNSYTFSFLDHLSAQKINGIPVNSRCMYLLEPDQYILSTFDQKSSYLSLKIPKHTFLQALEIDPTKNTTISKMEFFYAEKYTAELKQLLFHLILDAPDLPHQANIDIEDSIMSLVLQIRNDGEINSIDSEKNSRYRVVNRAVKYIKAHCEITPSILDVCKHSYCSQRTLEYAFKQVLGMTPKKFLILCRMHNIRRELPNYVESDIMNLLDKYGILNSSRFFSDFKLLFGDSLINYYTQASSPLSGGVISDCSSSTGSDKTSLYCLSE
jgi:AraC-like DNA-binding protein